PLPGDHHAPFHLPRTVPPCRRARPPDRRSDPSAHASSNRCGRAPRLLSRAHSTSTPSNTRIGPKCPRTPHGTGRTVHTPRTPHRAGGPSGSGLGDQRSPHPRSIRRARPFRSTHVRTRVPPGGTSGHLDRRHVGKRRRVLHARPPPGPDRSFP